VFLNINMNPGFQKILDEYQVITEQLASGAQVDIARLGRRQVELMPVVEKIQHLEKVERELEENKHLLDGNDQLMRNMVEEEIKMLETKLIELNETIETDLLPKDEHDDKNAIVEIRAGAGGDESTLFAAEMYRAYTKFAEKNKWAAKIISSSKSDVSGFKE